MKEDLASFRADIDDDEGLRQRLRDGEDPVAVAEELGYDVTREDIQAAVQDPDVELTEFELEMVSGGVTVDGSWGKIKQEPGTTLNNPDISNQLGDQGLNY